MFNGFDIIVLVIVLLFCLAGFKTGIVSTIFSLASGYVGLFVATKYSAQLGMNFYLVFGLLVVAIIALGLFLGNIAQDKLLGTFDNIMGMILGAGFGIMLVSILMFPVLNKLSWKNQVYVVSSYSGIHIIPSVQKLLPPVKELSFKQIKQMIKDQKLIAEKATVKSTKAVKSTEKTKIQTMINKKPNPKGRGAKIK